jgi:iron uptake system component EfeO
MERARAQAGRLGTALLLAATLGLALHLSAPAPVAVADAPHGDTSIAGTPVEVSQEACGSGWSGGAAGPVTLALWNASGRNAEAALQNTATHAYLLYAENLGADVTRAETVTLGPGSYRLLCFVDDETGVAGPARRVTGSYAGAVTPAVLPVSATDLIEPLLDYQRWISGRLAILQRKLARFEKRLRRGDVARARRSWLAAHRGWIVLGAAYDAFGDVGDAIDGRPTPGVAPATDHGLTGFHKIEALLWAQGRPSRHRMRAVILPALRSLAASVTQIQRGWGTTFQVAPIDLGLRTHEILEDGLRWDLTGRTDAGSHTTLAALDAEVTGTRAVLAFLRPLLQPRDPDLAATDAWLHRLKADVDRYRRARHAWTPLQSLSVGQLEQLHADLDQALEYLSEIAVLTDPAKVYQ